MMIHANCTTTNYGSTEFWFVFHHNNVSRSLGSDEIWCLAGACLLVFWSGCNIWIKMGKGKLYENFRWMPKKTMKIQKVSQQEKSTNILSNMGKFSPVPDPTRPLSRSSNLGASQTLATWQKTCPLGGISGGLASSNEVNSLFGLPTLNYNNIYITIYIQ